MTQESDHNYLRASELRGF